MALFQLIAYPIQLIGLASALLALRIEYEIYYYQHGVTTLQTTTLLTLMIKWPTLVNFVLANIGYFFGSHQNKSIQLIPWIPCTVGAVQFLATVGYAVVGPLMSSQNAVSLLSVFCICVRCIVQIIDCRLIFKFQEGIHWFKLALIHLVLFYIERIEV